MDSTPPYHRSDPKSRTKSSSRLSKLRYYNEQKEVTSPNLSLEIIPSSPTMASPSPSRSSHGLPLHEILLLSPSPLKKSKTRLAERLERAADGAVEGNVARNGIKNRNISWGLLAHASPRNNRRSRRRLEQDMREEKDFGGGEEMVVKPRKKRHSGRSKKDKLSLVPSVPSPKTNDQDEYNLDGVRQVITFMIMWKYVAKSSLWFGFGSICFLSSCFTSGINFSVFSVLSQMGLLFLALSFFTNSVRQRDGIGNNREFKLKNEDILRVGRLILPAANLAISKTGEIFSGEPAMTLKVSLLASLVQNYIPLTQFRYAEKTWRACSHKKIVAASAVTAFWNLTSIRNRIFAAFICLVIVRYSRQHQQHLEAKVEEEDEVIKEPERELQQALIVVANEPKK